MVRDNLERIEEFIKPLLEKGVFPGISILCGQKDRVRFKENYGYKSLAPKQEKIAQDTFYDVASLTKPLITAFITLYLLQRDQLAVNTPVIDFFPKLPDSVTLQHLLTHTSGLPAWFPLYLYPEDYLSQIQGMKLVSPAGKKVNYSCVGYILLYFII